MLPFLTQLLPILVFIVVDAMVSDVRISILAAVLFAVGQLAVTYARSRRFEWLVLIDVGLILALGAISIAFDNELFFEVKPAILEGVAVVLMVALIFAPDRFVLRYVERMAPPGRALRVDVLKSMLGVISVCTVLHIGAVLYTAFYSSREVWALVSGPGFYVLILPVGLVAGLRLRARHRSD